MRAAIFHEPGKPLTIESVPDPVPGSGEVIIEVNSCAICGSDLHMTQYPGLLPSGSILGHEFVGTVVDANGTGLAVGTRATAIPLFACWNCDDCRNGHFAHCGQLRIVGVGGTPGAFAGYVSVAANVVRPLPTGIRFDEGALIEPLAVGHHAVAHAGSLAGKSVLIMGAGQVGAAVTLFAAERGARHVIVSEPAAGRRERALAVGATAVIDPTLADVGAQFAKLTGDSPDVVFECVGIPGMIATAVSSVRRRGQVVVVGACFLEDQFRPMAALGKEVVLRFSSAYSTQDFDSVIDAFAHERIRPAPLITARIGLDAMPDMFERLRQPSDECLVIVELG
jgi:(R,R)-butanediol dehydrogenase/meso-butanediol dehydrogenase/diacetyl reductase